MTARWSTAAPSLDSLTRDTLVIQWNDLHPGDLVPANGQLLQIERLIEGQWRVVSWDDDPELAVRSVKKVRRRGWLWEAQWATFREGAKYRVVLLERQSLPRVVLELS